PDLGGPGQEHDRAVEVELELDCRMRLASPVHRLRRAADIVRTGHAEALAARQLAAPARLPAAFALDQSRHSGRPYEFTIRSFGVKAGARKRLARRTANGSSLSAAAISSSRLSKANRTSTVPWPRKAPHGGVLVRTRLPIYLTLSRS